MANPLPFLNELEIEEILRDHPQFKAFWQEMDHTLIVRKFPTPQDPIYEIQLAWQLGDRLETFGWIWMEAFQGKVLYWRPD